MPNIDTRPQAVADLMATLPDYWWSVDPGDKNVGLSMWTGAVCFDSFHTNPNDTVDLLVKEVSNGGLKLLVYEAFNLQGFRAAEQHGSEFLTAQMIGAMRHICRRAGVPTKCWRPADHKVIFKKLEHRPPNRPVEEWRSYGRGGHSKDSECLGEYFVRTIILKGRGY